MERPFPAYKGDAPYIFVSYAHEDAELAYPEITRLKDQGFNIWYDEGISPGSTWRDEVALALTQCKVFLFYITPRSVVSSNCLKEVNFSLSRERRILSVHLEKTELPAGLELSLSDMQAIIRSDHSEQAYQLKLADSLRSLLPQSVEAIEIPISQPVVESRSDEKSIGILPLVNRSNDPDNEYLSDGISEELIRGLSNVEGLRVASQIASFAFKSQHPNLKSMGRELDVETILSGSVQKAGNKVRISVLLSRVKDGSSLWSQRYDRELDDIFELQDDVARQVIEALRIELGSEASDKLIDTGTNNTTAYNAYLLGLHEYKKFSRRGYMQAIEYLEQAIQYDSSFAAAYGLVGWCYYYLMNVYGLPRDEMSPKAREAFDRAKALQYEDRVYPWVEIYRLLDPEHSLSEKEFAQQACDNLLSPEPSLRFVEYRQIAECLIHTGLFQASIYFAEQYLQRGNYSLGDIRPAENLIRYALAALGQYDLAIQKFTEWMEVEPDAPLLKGERAFLYSRSGQYSKAEQDLKTIGKVWSRNFPQFCHLFWKGEMEEAREYFESMEKMKNFAIRYKTCGSFMLGDVEKGIDYLEQMVKQDTFTTPFLRAYLHRFCPQSRVKEVEEHPRYTMILERIGFDNAWRDELIVMVNRLTHITGLHIQLDEEY